MNIMRTPKSADISITSRCNLRCSYCSHFTGPGDVNTDLPAGEWEQFFEELGNCAVLNVTLGGGEPFIRNDLPEIINGIVQNRMRFTILSNGTLITDDNARFIAGTGRCDGVQVSVDGAVPETHDAARGDGAFLKAMDGIEKLRKHGVPVSVRVTIHRHNVNYLHEIAGFLLEDLGLSGFSTNSAAYLGNCRDNADDIRLTVDEHSGAMATLMKLEHQYNGRITASSGPLANVVAWQNMERRRKKGQNIGDEKGLLTSCGGVFSKLAVRSDGVMVPCTQMSHIELGRILEDDLKTVWQQHPELKRLRERRKISLLNFDFCRGCDYYSGCSGGCPAEAFTNTGKEDHPNPDSCLRRFLQNGGTLPIGAD